MAKASSDPYFLALYSGALFNVAKKTDAEELSKKVANS